MENRTIIRPSGGSRALDLKEIWAHRELLYFFIWKDIKVRYKQTVIGAAWAILQPFAMMLIFSIFFGKFAKMPSDGLPYPIFAYSALVPWAYFSSSLTNATGGIVEHQAIITKIYFPRILLPLAAVLRNLLDFFIAFLVLVGMMVFYHIAPTARAWMVLPFILLAVITAFGTGLWLCALNVAYRDVKYVITLLIQIWLFATPIAYPVSIVPEKWRALYGINPMVGVVEGFRWALLNKPLPSHDVFAASVLCVLLVFIGGLYYFKKTERTFADVV